MPGPGLKEAIEAINACAELSDAEKASAYALLRDHNVVAILTSTPAAERVDTIRQLIALPAAAAPVAPHAGQQQPQRTPAGMQTRERTAMEATRS